MTSITEMRMLPLEEPGKDEPFKLTNLARDTEHYKQIELDFSEANLSVENVQRVESYNIWNRYTNKKNEISQRIPQSPDFKLNETFLYHGTAADISAICEEGFEQLLSKKGCFGPGVYFSDSPKKCEKYAKGHHIIVARVILGEAKVYSAGKRNDLLKREPEKDGQYDGWRYYDSVKGRPRDHMEYVIYRGEMALIEYLITFSKAGARPQQPSPVKQPSADWADVEEAKGSSDSVSDDDWADVEEAKGSSDSDSDDDVKPAKDHDTNSDSDEDFEDGVIYSSAEEEENVTDDSDEPEEHETQRPAFFDTQLIIPLFTVKEGDLTEDQKKEEYKRVTEETDETEVDSMLKKTDGDVERAIFLFFAYKQVKEEEAQKQAGQFVDDDPIEDDGSPIFPPMEPEYESDEWKKLGEDNKKEKMEKMVTDFLTFTVLEVCYREIAKTFLSDAKYNLDTAILNFYTSFLRN